MARFVQALDDAGFDTIGFTDHPAPSDRWMKTGGHATLDPPTALAFCAAVTERIRLLTFTMVLPYRNPLLAAKQIATLDIVSGGRALLGVGAGYLKSEYAAMGAEFATRNDVLDDDIELMQAFWSGEPLVHRRDDFDASGAVCIPGPVQRPHPPVWVGGNSARARERVARYGSGWMPYLLDETLARTNRTAPLRDLDEMAAAIDDLRVRLDRHGRTLDEIEIQFGDTVNVAPLDIRTGWSNEAFLDRAGQLDALGIHSVVVFVDVEDPAAAVETVERFGQEVVARA